MKNRFLKHIIILFLFFFGIYSAQNVSENFEKEKTYLHTNHVFYKPGETVFFKIYVVNAKNNTPTNKSRVVNVHLINPSGEISKKLKYRVKDGFATGSFDFSEDEKGGIYRLKVFTNWMQNETGKNFFEKEITLQKTVSPRILMKLDFPKKGYGSGDEVIADFSMRSLGNFPISFYGAKYSVFIDGNEVKTDFLKTDKEGKYQLIFRLPEQLKTNDGLLNITVNYDGFTENISKKIPITLGKIDLRFFPEGGSFVNGFETNLAFKALDEFEKPVDIKGEIFDEKNTKVADFSSYHFGMGSLKFTPIFGKKYFAKLIEPEGNQQTFELPAIQNTGLALNVVKTQPKLILKINSAENKTVIIAGTHRNINYFEKAVNLNTGENVLEIDQTVFPSGIARFTIFEDKIPLAERIVFLNPEKVLNIKIKPFKKQYLPREKVVLDIETTDEKNLPIPANLSVSTVDDKLWTYADDKQDNILSWLLMSSELSGKIEEPNFYFKKEEAKAKHTLDLVMLTNGYRYFELIPEIISKNTLKYLPEKLNGVFGMVHDENKNPISADVFLVETDNYNYENSKILQQTTKNDGRFYFENLNGNYSNKIIAKSKNPKQKVKIKILSYNLNINPIDKTHNPNNVDVEEIIKDVVENVEKKEIVQHKFKQSNNTSRKDTAKIQEIEEAVIVSAYRTTKNNTNAAIISKEDKIPNSDIVNIVQGRLSGVQIVAQNQMPGKNASIIIRGYGSLSGNTNPLYVVDGVITEQFSATINPNDINSITVLKDATATSIYGSRASNGVVIINTLNYKQSQFNLDVTPENYYDLVTVRSDSLTQFSYSRKFSYPVYNETATPYRFDFRETIYWNPVIQTDKNGKAQIEFYNSDANTTYRIISEGIGYNGLVGRSEETYAAQSSIAVDAKIPPYLTMADRPKIPLVIKNNSASTQIFNINTIIPKKIKIGKYDTIAVLKPLEAKRLIIPLETGKTVNSDISFAITSENERETTILPLKVQEKGFPNRFAIITSKDTLLNFNLPEHIPETAFVKLKIYKNIVSKMLEDVERLKREPYGCFEQISSTVYPNIFILDFLKSQNKITEENYAIAERNLKTGYRKLSGYELENGGFGYFHSSDFNLSLSAFALLELTDLSKKINVNQNILERTRAAILSRRSTTGLFNINYSVNKNTTGKYWAEHAFTVYALAKSGMHNEILKQYEVAYQRAIGTKDSYQTALLAITAKKLQRNEDYKKLIEILNVQFKNSQLESYMSFVQSRGFSLHSENLALYLLALLEDENISVNYLTKVVDQLNARNGYYGFGSTQATVLALEALTKYYRKANFRIDASNRQNFTFNQQSLDLLIKNKDEIDLTEFLKKQNTLDVKSNSGRSFPYAIEWGYYTLNAPVNENTEVKISSSLSKDKVKIGDINRMTVKIQNVLPYELPMVVAKVGIPAGLSIQPDLLKDLIVKKQISYYEIFDNYLVLYWERMKEKETKTINLDLKAEFPGEYIGKASSVYLFYTPENKHWNDGLKVEIEDEN